MTLESNAENPASPTADPLSDSLRWALALGAEPDQSPIDWLAMELDPESKNAADAVCRSVEDPNADLDRLELLKSGFKSLRLSSESGSDRSLAARYYASTIAAGVVRHGLWITGQRPERVSDAIRELHEDESMPASLRRLAADAIAAIEQKAITRRNRG
ncbi:MAG: hypothetical protein GY895_01195 [Phycisphaera sp.]|nr:hypothetical protein [Phycisphaera sp.]